MHLSRPGGSDRPIKDYLTEKPLGRQESEQMIEDYYEEWGWDRKTGVPTAQVLRELGLTDD